MKRLGWTSSLDTTAVDDLDISKIKERGIGKEEKGEFAGDDEDKAVIASTDNVGGIDLRTSNWSLSVMKSYQSQLNNAFKFDPSLIKINGLTPFIINIQPVSVNQLLGLDNVEGIQKQLTYNGITK